MNKLFSLILMATIAALQVSAQQLSDSLLLYYPLDGSAVDQSCNGFNGAVYGPTPTMDRFGNPNGALYFDGVDDYIEWTNDASLKPNFPISFSFWVKFENMAREYTQVFTTDYEEDDYTGAWLSVDTFPHLEFGGGQGVTNINNRRSKDADTALIPNVWYHLAGVLRGATDMELYVGTDSVAGSYTGNGPTSIAYSSLPGGIGRRDLRNLPPYYFWGSIDDFRYWNRELTAQEVFYLGQAQGCSTPFYDTTFVTVYDTAFVTVYDSISVTEYDTIVVTIYDSIAVTDTLVIHIATGLNQPDDMNAVKIFPNPTSDMLFIDNGNYGLISNHSVKIIDALGQQIFYSQINAPSFSVDLSLFGGAGLYFVQILDAGSQVVQERKIVLQ